MKIKDKVVVVTGAASGIGKALAARFAKEGARGVVCADLNENDAKASAAGKTIWGDKRQPGDSKVQRTVMPVSKKKADNRKPGDATNDTRTQERARRVLAGQK